MCNKMIVHQLHVRSSSHLGLCSTQYSLYKQHGGCLSGWYASGTVQIDFILSCDGFGVCNSIFWFVKMA